MILADRYGTKLATIKEWLGKDRRSVQRLVAAMLLEFPDMEEFFDPEGRKRLRLFRPMLYTLPQPDAIGRTQPTTFITLLALTAFVLRSDLAVKPGSNANLFANALLKKMSQGRAHKAEALIRALAPAIEHQTKASTRLVRRHLSRAAAMEAEVRSLREQLAQAHETVETARADAEKAIADAAAMQQKWIVERRAKSQWQDAAETGNLRIIQLEEAARREREARTAQILEEERKRQAEVEEERANVKAKRATRRMPKPEA